MRSTSIFLGVLWCLQCAKEGICKMQKFSKCLQWRLLPMHGVELWFDLTTNPWQCVHDNTRDSFFLLRHDIKSCCHSRFVIKFNNGVQSRYFSSSFCLSICCFKFIVLYDLWLWNLEAFKDFDVLMNHQVLFNVCFVT